MSNIYKTNDSVVGHDTENTHTSIMLKWCVTRDGRQAGRWTIIIIVSSLDTKAKTWGKELLDYVISSAWMVLYTSKTERMKGK